MAKKNAYKKQWSVSCQTRVIQWFFVIIFIVCAAVLLLCAKILQYESPEHITVVDTMTVVATAYTSHVWQTDDTPCITANGYDLCENNSENVIATNFLPFGTKVRFPELFGDQIFEVQDRMNTRYGRYRVDIWMTSLDKAIDFGAKRLVMEVLE